MRALSLCIVALLAAAVAGAPGAARAQIQEERGRVLGGQDTRKRAWQLPYQYRRALEEREMLRQRPTEDIRQVEAKPIVDAMGRQLVGIVENRTLTKPQLDLRVNLMLQYLPEIRDAQEALDRRVGIEGRIVSEWTKATALAVAAERLGYKATPVEVDQVLKDLSAKSSTDPNQATQQVRLLGIPEAELRRELEDGIIVEKMLRAQIEQMRDEDLKRVFAKDPDVFLEPTRVNAWHLLSVMINSPTDDQLKATQKALAKLAKRLKKCDEQAEYEALQKEIMDDKALSGDMGIRLAYLKEVGANEPLQGEVLKALFGQKPGSISDIFATGPKSRPTELHVIKVLERKEGHRGAYEEAKPQVQNFMAEKLKEFIYAGLQEKYDIRTDPAGLNEYKEIARIPARPTPTPGARAAARPTPPPVATLTNPFARVPGGAFEPPPVESVVGAKAELPQGKPALSPAAAAALRNGPSPAGLSSLPGLPAPSLSADDLATSAAATMEQAPPAIEKPQTTVRRSSRRRSRPQPNFDAAPPSVGEVLGRQAR